MIEGRHGRENFLCLTENLRSHGGVALLRNQFCRIVGPQLRQEEEIGNGADIAEQTDSLVDQGSDGSNFLRRGVRKAGLVRVRQQAPSKFIEVEPANMFRIQPDGLRIEGILDRKSTRLNSSHANISY